MAIRWNVVGVSLILALLLAQSLGCNAAARSLGNIPVTSIVGPNAIDASGFPLDHDLWVHVGNDRDGPVGPNGIRAHSDTVTYTIGKPQTIDKSTAIKTGDLSPAEDGWIPLVRIGLRPTLEWGDRFLNGPSLGTELPGLKGPGEWSDHNVYVVVDVANAMRIPHLGAYNSKGEFDLDMYRRRLGKIGNLLIQAADRNGDVYWRNLSTFLEYVGAVESAAKAAQGAGIAAAFISPVLGAALAGSGVATDAFFDDVTDSFDVETYAQLRESASTKREIMAKRIHTAVANATPQKGGLESVIRGANDYAYSYSLKGTIYITKEEDDKLKDLLITGESSWSVYFLEDRIRYLNTKLLSASEAESQEIQRQLESAKSVRDSLVESSKDEADRLRETDRIPVGPGVGGAGG